MSLNIPKIATKEGILAHQNELVYLKGIYIQNDVRMRRKNPDILHKGHVAILLEDKTKVYMYPPDQTVALRDVDEIKKFENSKVLLKCKILPYIPQSTNQMQQASVISAPCIVELISIREI